MLLADLHAAGLDSLQLSSWYGLCLSCTQLQLCQTGMQVYANHTYCT